MKTLFLKIIRFMDFILMDRNPNLQESWNIRDLKTILNRVNDSYDQEIKGVNSPYLYFGCWKATFR